MPVRHSILFALLLALAAPVSARAESVTLRGGRTLDVRVTAAGPEGLRCEYDGDALLLLWSHMNFEEVRRVWQLASLGDLPSLFALAEYCLENKQYGPAREYYGMIEQSGAAELKTRAAERIAWIDESLVEREVAVVAADLGAAREAADRQDWKKAYDGFKRLRDETDPGLFARALEKCGIGGLPEFDTLFAAVEASFYESRGYVKVNGVWQPPTRVAGAVEALARDPENLRKIHAELLSAVFEGGETTVTPGRRVVLLTNYAPPAWQVDLLDQTADFCASVIGAGLPEVDLLPAAFLETRGQFKEYAQRSRAGDPETAHTATRNKALVSYSYLDRYRMVFEFSASLLREYLPALREDNGLFTNNLPLAVEFALTPGEQWKQALHRRAAEGWLIQILDLIDVYDTGGVPAVVERRSTGLPTTERRLEAGSLVYFLMQSPKYRKRFKGILENLRQVKLVDQFSPEELKSMYEDWRKFILS